MPAFRVAEPTRLGEALELLSEHGPEAVLLAGGTDLLPNLKHQLLSPAVVVSLARIPELHGLAVEPDGTLRIGALTTLDTLARDERVRASFPALAQAASLVAGPQLRRMGTLGGNVMLDTRCQWYNQTHFWRSALGFCLKKDGTVCHVVAGGANCVAAASNDTAPALMTLDAELVFESMAGRRTLPIDELYTSDGIHNKSVRDEVLVEVRVPRPPAGHRGAYAKLRDRGSIDFPLLGLAARIDLDPENVVQGAALCAVALQARPARLRKAVEPLLGLRATAPAFDAALESAAELARKQCRPLDNVPGDADYRRAMVPVAVRRVVRAALAGEGPVHPL